MSLPESFSVDSELASIIQHVTIDEDTSHKPQLDALTSEADSLEGITVARTSEDGSDHDSLKSRRDSSLGSSAESEYATLVKRVQAAAHQVAILLNNIYEIQELRHASSSTPTSLDTLLSSMSDTTTLLRHKITALQASVAEYAGPHARDIADELEELLDEWKGAEEGHRLLRDEMKEDGWLVRFRTTADQAEAMIDPLQKSYAECMRYVERFATYNYHQNTSGEASIDDLEKAARSHESMTMTYAPSIAKIMKMIDQGISERPIKNGEALRRFSEMTHRWTTLQKQLQQLDARIRVITSQYARSDLGGSPGEVEILADTSPYGSPDSRGEYFAYSKSPSTHRSSISSNTSSRSRLASHPQAAPSTLSPDTALRPHVFRRPSVSSNTSATTERNAMTDQANWNSSMTPTHKRTSTTPAQLLRSVSPTLSNASTASRRQSRIPVPSPSRFAHEYAIPGLSVSTSHGQTMLTPGRGMKTPEPARPRISAAFSAYQPRPSVGGTLRTYSSGTTPKTAPHRLTLSRAPPSSFHSPTPSGTRPSSRLSMMSCATVNPATLTPFNPSKYDQLDMEVSRILDEVSFDLFVARIDQAMKRGQRRRDDEEWKGVFVFGAGEKPTGVKLLKITGAKAGSETRVKCLVRAGGAWHDLASVLRARLAAVRGG